MLILADTSCWIEFFRPIGDEAVRAQMLVGLADGLAICGPVPSLRLVPRRAPGRP